MTYTVWVAGWYFGFALTGAGRDELLRMAARFGVPSLTITKEK